LVDVEAVAEDEVLLEALLGVLDDNERSGHPMKFPAEQEDRVRALACRTPSEFGLPAASGPAGCWPKWQVAKGSWTPSRSPKLAAGSKKGLQPHRSR
jgi:hypothetical protein